MRERVCRERRATKKKKQTNKPQQHTFRTAAVGNLTGVNKRIVKVQIKAGSH